MELRKIRHGETTMNACKALEENKTYESAMMCWESLDDSKPTSKKRKTLSQEEATNDQADEKDNNKLRTKRTANTGIGSLIPVNDLQLGADDDALTLATQETLAKNLVYITNIPDGKMDRTKTTRDPSKNSGQQDGKQSSLLANPDQVTSNDKFNAYGESESDAKMKKGKAHKTNTWQAQKIIYMEFESDDDVAEQSKNANHVKKEGKVRVTKKTVHYYEFSSDEEEGAHADPKKLRKPMMITRIQVKKLKMIKLLSPMR